MGIYLEIASTRRGSERDGRILFGKVGFDSFDGSHARFMRLHKGERTMTETARVKTVERAFKVVTTLRRSGPAGISEIAETLELPTSTVNDHLQTLKSCGYVVKTNDTYHLGTRFLFIGDRLRRQMRLFQSSKQVLESLADETAEHASLTIEEDGIGVILDDIRGQKAIEFNTYPGMRTQLHLSAAGKAILAFLPEHRVVEILEQRGLKRMTENTITSKDELLEELDRIRADGFATDMGESITGMRGVGVPILDKDDTLLGGISVYGARSRITDERLSDELPTVLREAANVIEVEYEYKQRGGN